MDRKRFDELVAAWEVRTGLMSSTTRITGDPAFAEIVALGETAVPWIVDFLRDRPSFLYVAWHRITGETPWTDSDKGRIEEICKAVVDAHDARAASALPSVAP